MRFHLTEQGLELKGFDGRVTRCLYFSKRHRSMYLELTDPKGKRTGFRISGEIVHQFDIFLTSQSRRTDVRGLHILPQRVICGLGSSFSPICPHRMQIRCQTMDGETNWLLFMVRGHSLLVRNTASLPICMAKCTHFKMVTSPEVGEFLQLQLGTSTCAFKIDAKEKSYLYTFLKRHEFDKVDESFPETSLVKCLLRKKNRKAYTMGGVLQYDRTRFDNWTKITKKSTLREILGEALYRLVPIGLQKGKAAILKILISQQETKKGKTSGKKRKNRSHSPNSEKDKKVRKIEKSNSTTDDRESNSDRHDRERKGRPPNHSM